MIPGEHLVQIYEDRENLLDTLERFVLAGLRAGEDVVVIATPEHRALLEARLRDVQVDIDRVSREGRYLALDAARTLASFINRGWPDDLLFGRMVSDIFARVGTGGRRVRAFGEMVVLLWEAGHTGATIRLEHLWHELCHERGLSLLCAYPRSSFENSSELSARQICASHSRVVTA